MKSDEHHFRKCVTWIAIHNQANIQALIDCDNVTVEVEVICNGNKKITKFLVAQQHYWPDIVTGHAGGHESNC